MAIVSSVIVGDDHQADSRRWIRERHTDNIGLVRERIYLTAAGTDAVAAMTAYAPQLAADIAASEIAANLASIEMLGSLAVISTVYTTLSQTIVAARADFLTAKGLAAANLGDWFNTLSFVQLQSAFGFANVSAFTTFKASFFTPNATTAISVRSATGA